MNTRQIPTTDDEGVSPPYRPPGPMARQTPRPMPTISLRPDWFEHEAVRAAGVHATYLWLCACGEVRRRGGSSLSLTDLRRLVDFEGLGVKTKPVIEAGIAAGLFARTKTEIIVFTDALDERRG